VLLTTFAGLLLIGCQATGTGGGGEPESAGDVEEVNVGVVMPLTGGNAQFGQNSRRGIELAAEMINEDGGIESMDGAKIKLKVADSTSDPTRAASATQQFLSSQEKPVAVIGAYASSLTQTVSQVTERNKMPLLTTSFSDELTSRGYKYIFRVAPKATDVGAAQLEYAVEIARNAGATPKSVAITFTNDEYGTSQAEGLRKAAEERGLEIALFEPYESNITNATPLARKITGADADILFPVSYLTDGIQIMRALAASGSNVPVVGGVGGFITPDFRDALGDSVNGIFSVMTSAPDKYGDIGERYREKYGTFMPQEAHDNAAALSVIAQALEAKPTTDPTELAETLHSQEFDEGIAAQMPGGSVDFDEAGNNIVIEPLMVQWQGGELVSVWPKNLAKSEPRWPKQ
jgi:branched-chain amino acid transport system substrate-binding protein